MTGLSGLSFTSRTGARSCLSLQPLSGVPAARGYLEREPVAYCAESHWSGHEGETRSRRTTGPPSGQQI